MAVATPLEVQAAGGATTLPRTRWPLLLLA